MILHRDISGLIKLWRRFVKDFTELLINRTRKLGVERIKSVARKGLMGKGTSPLKIYNVRAPFEKVQMDVLGSLPTILSGNKYLLVIVDCFTK